MKTIKYTLLMLLMLLGNIAVSAQDDNGPRPSVEEMHMHKWQYIVEKARLTPQQAAAVQPVFMEYEKSVWKLMEDNHKFYKKAHKSGNNDNPNFQEFNDRYVNSEMQKAQLLKNYYQKLRKILSAETIYQYFKAERAFKRDLIQDMKNHRPPERRP